MLGSLYSIKKAAAVNSVRIRAASWVHAPTISRTPPTISITAKIFKTTLALEIFNTSSEISQRPFSRESFNMPVLRKVKPATTRTINGASMEKVSRSGKTFSIELV